MGQNRLHDPFSQSLAAMLFQNIDISEIGKRRSIGNHSSEASLIALLIEEPKAQCSGDSLLHDRSRNSRRPIGTRQISMNRGYIESRLVSRDGVAVALNLDKWVLHSVLRAKLFLVDLCAVPPSELNGLITLFVFVRNR